MKFKSFAIRFLLSKWFIWLFSIASAFERSFVTWTQDCAKKTLNWPSHGLKTLWKTVVKSRQVWSLMVTFPCVFRLRVPSFLPFPTWILRCLLWNVNTRLDSFGKIIMRTTNYHRVLLITFCKTAHRIDTFTFFIHSQAINGVSMSFENWDLWLHQT